MDSRIREIEQWIEKAKSGLLDGGREEYVKKLYLLDAEIRAVIKENGTLPGVNYSPERRGSGARRSATRLAAAGALAGIIVLGAAAAWFAGPASHTRWGVAPTGTELAISRGEDGRLPAGHIPGMISGEEVVVASWLDDNSIELLAARPPVATDSGGGEPVRDIGPVLASLQAQPVLPAAMSGGGQPVMLAADGRGGTSGAVLLQQASYSASLQAAMAAPRAMAVPAATVERFVSVDIVDNSNPQDPDDVDKLDPDALKRNVEKHFAK